MVEKRTDNNQLCNNCPYGFAQVLKNKEGMVDYAKIIFDNECGEIKDD